MKVLEKLLFDLDETQKKAVEAKDGPIMVFAGAGSGKTRVLTYRIAYLLLERSIPSHRIFAVTFTNKAADEMKQRLEALVGKAVENMWLGTFHAACARMLRQHGQAIGLANNFLIYDEDDQRNLVKTILKELNIDSSRYPVATLQAAISDAKTEMVTPEELSEVAETHFQKVIAKVYKHYQEALKRAKAVDFDDLLWLALKMLREHPQIADYYQTRFLHVLVDEYQDVNKPQHELTLLLVEKHRNLFVIGDDDQNIYSWRGSNVRLMLDLEKHFPGIQVFTLERNYRSTQTILDTAWHVIKHNRHRHEKRLYAVRERGDPVVLFRAQDDYEEAAFIASVASELVGKGKYRFSDFAAIYRINALSRPFEETFLRWGIPYRVVGALRFYERKEIKDIIAYLRILANSHDELSLVRIINLPPRGIGEKTLEKLRLFALQKGVSVLEAILSEEALKVLETKAKLAVKGFAELVKSFKAQTENLSLAQLIQRIIEGTGYGDYIIQSEGQFIAQERLENLAQLVSAAERQFPDLPASQSLQRFLDQLALLSPQDEANWQSDVFTLITAHSAKGLEFPVVFIVGLEEGLFPHARSLNDLWQLEEERRLFYVALTRAKDKAFLTYAQRRGRTTGKWGETKYMPTEPSRFLNEMPMNLIDEWRGVPTPQGFLRMKEPVFAPKQKLDVREIVRGMPIREASEVSLERKQIGEPKTTMRFDQVRVGMRVKHREFGTGTIVEVEPDEKLPTVIVSFDDPSVGKKRLALEFAPLEPLP